MKTEGKNYRIVVDTGCDLEAKEEERLKVLSVPFKIDIEDRTFVDDDNLDIKEFISAMMATKNPIRTACPSPMEFEEVLNQALDADGIFIFTISKNLSGSYNSANVAMEQFKEKNPHMPICLIDTESASAGQTNVTYKVKELMEKGLDFEGIKKEIEGFIQTMSTFFILESLENLMKNGRIRKSAGLIVNALNIKPIMRDNGSGDIELFQINRGFKKSIRKLADYIIEEGKKREIKMLTISHADALEKANDLKERILSEISIETIRIVHTKGLASGYADVGGIVVAF